MCFGCFINSVFVLVIVFLWGYLLYFSGGFAGRVKVACTLLYSIFNVGRGLLYFSAICYCILYDL